MTQCAPAGIFTLAGAYQMIVWALGKHRNYRTEFKVRAVQANCLNCLKSFVTGVSQEEEGSHSIHTLEQTKHTQSSKLQLKLVSFKIKLSFLELFGIMKAFFKLQWYISLQCSDGSLCEPLLDVWNFPGSLHQIFQLWKFVQSDL
mgnify:FL=1